MTRRTVLKVSAVPAILLGGVLAMQVLGSAEKETNKREDTPEPRAVETQLLSFANIALEVEGDGVVESERMLNIVSEASGKVLYAKNDLKDGTYVREGDLILRIDSRDVENNLFGLRSEFMNAVASVLPELQIDDAHVYKRWFDYFNSLDISTTVPELPEITNAQEKIKVSTKDIIGKYYSVRNQEILLSKYTIRAPFDGYISSSGVIENSFVSVGQQLFALTDPKNLVVTVPLAVEESQAIQFSTAPRATIYADDRSGEVTSGRVTRKETNVDRNSQTLNVYVTFTNPALNPHFLPGNYVHVSIDARLLRDVAAIPRNLLDNDNYVFTMEDGVLGRQQVEVVALQRDLAIVSHTTPDETMIVTTILQTPLLGMAVRSINMPDPAVETDLAEEEDLDSSADQLADDGNSESDDEEGSSDSVAAGG